MHLSHTVYIHIIKHKSVQYEQLIYSGPTTLAPEYQSLLHINHIKSCPSYWHHTFILFNGSFLLSLILPETSHRPFYISSILISTITITPGRSLPTIRIIVPSSRMASSPLTIIPQLISEQYMVEIHSLPGRYTIFTYLADYVNTLSPI